MRVADKPVGRVWRGSQGEEGLLIVVVVVVVVVVPLLLLLLLLLGEEDIDSSSTSLAGGQDDEEGTEGPERLNIFSLFIERFWLRNATLLNRTSMCV